MVISGIYGPGIWTEPIVELTGSKWLFGYDHLIGTHSIRDFWVLIVGLAFLLGHLPFCVLNVVKARQSNNLPVLPVFLEWTPIIVYTLSIGAWVYSPYSSIQSDNHLVLFCLTMSFVFGRMTTKMILAHLTRQPFPYWTVMLVPLVGGAILTNLPRLGFAPISAKNELLYLYGYFVFAAVVYFRWAYLVVSSICNYLGINALTIPYEKQLENKRRLSLSNGSANGAANGKKNL
jgi:ethanolaminephosphotransferase